MLACGEGAGSLWGVEQMAMVQVGRQAGASQLQQGRGFGRDLTASSSGRNTAPCAAQITGYEKCKWEDSETHSVGGRTETRWVTRDAERKFFKVTVHRI